MRDSDEVNFDAWFLIRCSGAPIMHMILHIIGTD